MLQKWLVLIVVAVAGLGWRAPCSAAPKPPDKETEKRDKAVKEFVAKVYDALGRHDFDTFVELCDVPYNIQPSAVASGIITTKEGFKEEMKFRYARMPKFDGSKHVVRSIKTLKEARNRFLDQQAADAAAVLPEHGLVVHVELDREAKPVHRRLLLRAKEGQFRLVGIQPADKDE